MKKCVLFVILIAVLTLVRLAQLSILRCNELMEKSCVTAAGKAGMIGLLCLMVAITISVAAVYQGIKSGLRVRAVRGHDLIVEREKRRADQFCKAATLGAEVGTVHHPDAA